MLSQLEKTWVQYISPEGVLRTEGQTAWEQLSIEEKKSFFRWMSFIRQFDRRSVILQRQGRIGTYAPLEGQEAAQVGSALALGKEDWIFPSYREHGVAMIAGMPLSQIFLYWMGRVEGCKPPEGVRLLPPSVPIATQIPHAVGAAWAAKLKKETVIAVAYFGDGATSEGDFHEACNFSGVFGLPVILFCQNNGYAISVPFSRQSASETVAEKAQAYRFPGIRVDGNDVLAVYNVMKQAIRRARTGQGPTLIEAVTYRKGSHTTADDATRYRPASEVEEWVKKRDPLERYTRLLKEEGLLSQAEEKEWADECKSRIDQAIKEAESSTPVPSAHLFAHVYATLSPNEQQQQQELLQRGGKRCPG
ncbi:pyruvate dehydrogenase (acetyl-transferring) E1 component subunit alpha [Paenactinomyces guangxiensis]|uniref:Pyruvate dehydrogenase E1 component subunit alpha n=1 Tax=Paenactinomyces guangxiensis TaxID=1490290 RepID=A0A7W1WRV3_9BACL|nr:pyruvate dehydrogenase (acetyl-transferring) E1 component subunit alpha [Paenactinomyces guangxiensis]MBA4494918.1 pyruvate dehydrogenase (acetyl-transferring) E1 component subunit alpha [Paenactinomyces guangxiensis]MBH8592001.1 pyruvate dehydrogenase (acetyl-transferring) E1 component subunit alpha [Paenactinomyces guangxiensis]